MIGAAMIAFGVWFFEWYRHRKPFTKKKKIAPAILALIMVLPFLNSCKTEPVKFNPGKDNCQFCRMSIVDTRYGGQIITKKGKVFLFDDMHCEAAFIKEGSVKATDMDKKLTVLFDKPNEFKDLKETWFVVSEENKSPMGSNAAGFSTREKATQEANDKHGKLINGEQLMAELK